MATQARSIASLTISFGLVAIPVKVYSATVSSERISFNLLRQKDGSRVKQQYIAVNDGKVVTLEGLGTGERPHPVQQAFIEEQAVQCGYCINGMIMQAAALLARTPKPSEHEIKAELANNLCRCGTHLRIVRAVKRAAGV